MWRALPQAPSQPCLWPTSCIGCCLQSPHDAACRVPVSLPAPSAPCLGVPAATTGRGSPSQHQESPAAGSGLAGTPVAPSVCKGAGAPGVFGRLCGEDLGTRARLAAEQEQHRLAASAAPGGPELCQASTSVGGHCKMPRMGPDRWDMGHQKLL